MGIGPKSAIVPIWAAESAPSDVTLTEPVLKIHDGADPSSKHQAHGRYAGKYLRHLTRRWVYVVGHTYAEVAAVVFYMIFRRFPSPSDNPPQNHAASCRSSGGRSAGLHYLRDPVRDIWRQCHT